MPILIDVSASWCPPCNDLAAYLDGQNEDFAGSYPSIREMVENGDVHWVTILGEDFSGPATNETPVNWHEAYPTENIPVLADKTYEIVDFIELMYWPTSMLLREDLTIEAFDREDPWKGVTKLEENYGY